MNYKELNFLINETAKIPYPKLEFAEEDYEFAQRLYNSYGGKDGELTAIITYIFQHINNKDKEIFSKAIQFIAIQEMKHFEILGEMIKKLGSVPYIMGTYNNKWCSDNVKTNFENFCDMIDFNILSENKAIDEYRKLIEYSQNENIKNILSRIIVDEECHIKIFEFLKKYDN